MPGIDPARRDAPPAGTCLRGYTLESVVGHGGFGIVYRAQHNELGATAAIKASPPHWEASSPFRYSRGGPGVDPEPGSLGQSLAALGPVRIAGFGPRSFVPGCGTSSTGRKLSPRKGFQVIPPESTQPPRQPLHPVRVESRIPALAGNAEDPLPPAVQPVEGRFSRRVEEAIDARLRLQERRRSLICQGLLGLPCQNWIAPDETPFGQESRSACLAPR